MCFLSGHEFGHGQLQLTSGYLRLFGSPSSLIWACADLMGRASVMFGCRRGQIFAAVKLAFLGGPNAG